MKPVRWLLRVLLVLLVIVVFFGSLLLLLANPQEVEFTTLVVAKPFEAALGQWIVLFFLAGVVLGGALGYVAGRLLFYRKQDKQTQKALADV